jgi:WD40 repeat protein
MNMQWANRVRLPAVLAGICILTLSGLAQTAPDRIWVAAGHSLAVQASAFSPDGATLASGSLDTTIKLWRTADASLVGTLVGHSDGINGVTFSHDGSLLASASSDTTIKLWSASTGALVRTLAGHTAGVDSVAFSPDGSVLVSGAADNTVRLWRVADGALLMTLTGHGNWVYSVAFSPDGSKVASASMDGTVRIWRASDGALLSVMSHSGYVFSVAFSPDGSAIASSSADLTVRLWRVTDGAPLRVISGFTDWVWSVAFSPDGGSLVTSDNDRYIKLFRVSDGALLSTLLESAVPSPVQFSPNGAQLGYGRIDYMVVLAKNPLANSSSGTPTTPTLDVLVSTDKASYINRSKATILVSVTDGQNAVAGSAVSTAVVSPNGTRTSFSGKTGSNGVAVFSYTVNSKQGVGTYKVSSTAALAGWTSGTGSTTFLVTR